MAKTLEHAASGSGGVESDGPVEEAEDPAEAAGSDLAAPLRRDAPVAFVFDNRGKLDGSLTLREAAETLKTKDLHSRIAGRLLVVDARVCGLRDDGLLSADVRKPVDTIEDNWGLPEEWDEAAGNVADAAALPAVRVRLSSDDDRDRQFADSGGTGDDTDRSAGAWRELWGSCGRGYTAYPNRSAP